MLNNIKQNWFRILMWGVFFIMMWSWIVVFTSNEKICGQDDIYDNNCEVY